MNNILYLSVHYVLYFFSTFSHGVLQISILLIIITGQLNSHSLFYADQGEKKKTVMQKWIQ